MAIKNFFEPFTALKHLGLKPHTIRLPYEKKIPADRVRGFHANDLEKCIGCGNCAQICTCQAIRMVEIPDLPDRFGATKFRPQVDYGRCSFCGQCVDVCPTGSLKLTDKFIWVTEDPFDEKNGWVFIPDNEKFKYEGKGWTTSPETSLLLLERHEMPERPPEERIRDFDPVILGFTEEIAVLEASRCMGCAICMQGCPTEMFIPHYLNAIERKDYERAVNIFFINNPLPEICGTVCTHRCENACVLGIMGKPIQIRYEKGFAASQVDDYRKVLKPSIPQKVGKKVAVIGGGPGGLTVAYYLSLKGFDVTIFEALDVLGGMMKVGIPRYRLPQNVLDKEINHILSYGVEVRYNTRVGKDVQFDDLLEQYDAVYIGVGYHKGLTMGIPGEDAEGVIQAIDFLRNTSLGRPPKIGKRVVVVGGGDTAMDATRTALRLGAEEVILSYRRRIVDMPASDEEKHEAMAEGVKFMPQTLPVEIVKDERGHVKAVRYVKTKMVHEPGAKRPRPVPIEDEVFEWQDVDTVIYAIGQVPDLSFLPEKWLEKLKLDRRGRHIVVDENGMTSIEGIFAGGDIVNPRADVISAIADGRRAAAGIENYLSGKK